MELKIELKGFEEADKLIRKTLDIPKNLSQEGLDEIGMAYASALQEQIGINESIATGALQNSFRARRVEDNTVHVSVIGPAARYAGYLEKEYYFRGDYEDTIEKWAKAKGVDYQPSTPRRHDSPAHNIYWSLMRGKKKKRGYPYVDKAMELARRDVDEIIKRHVER